MKRFLGLGEPNSQAIRAGSANIHTHLDYISYLTEERRWLAGNDFSLADISLRQRICPALIIWAMCLGAIMSSQKNGTRV